MKKTAALLMALGLALPAITFAQESDARRPRDEGAPPRETNRDEGGPREGMRRDAPPGRRDEAGMNRRGRAGDRRGLGPERMGEGRGPMVPPFFALLDLNHDGAIDKKELKHAMKQLDKNNDGKLTPDELRPRRLDGQGGGPPQGAGRGPNFGGPRGERGPAPDAPRPPRAPRPQGDRE